MIRRHTLAIAFSAAAITLAPALADAQAVGLAYENQGWWNQEAFGAVHTVGARLDFAGMELTLTTGGATEGARGSACTVVLEPAGCPVERLVQTTSPFTGSVGYAVPIRRFAHGGRLEVVPSLGFAQVTFEREGLETGNGFDDDLTLWELGAAVRYTSPAIARSWVRVFAETGLVLGLGGDGADCLDCFELEGGNQTRSRVMLGVVVGG